jgi:hypothetical protein
MRRLLVVPTVLIVAIVVGFVLGFGGQLPFFSILSVLCLTPMFLVTLGFAFGKVSNEYQFFVPKGAATQTVQRRGIKRPTADAYDVGLGDLRGN